MIASAFCPAHITGFFKAELEGKDPNHLGSLGAGFSIQKGVKTTVILSSRNHSNATKFISKSRDTRLAMFVFLNMC